MDALLESLTKSLTEQGWKVEMQENTQIPTEIAQRYDSLPTDYIYFLRNMKACVNSAETVWMLCPDDFAPQGEDGFAWNEFEKMSLDAAEGDNIWTAEIKSFWNEHLPILMTASFWNEWCRSSKCWLILLSVSGFLKPPLPQQMPFASKMNWPSALTGPISTRNI